MADISKIKLPSNNVYNIKDAGAQRTLVSGTNIKTVGGTSLLGSGDVSIACVGKASLSLTSSGDKITGGTITYSSGSYESVYAAKQAGKLVTVVATDENGYSARDVVFYLGDTEYDGPSSSFYGWYYDDAGDWYLLRMSWWNRGGGETMALSEVIQVSDTSDFITNAVNDLVNYYKKSETYTKTEVNNLLGSVSNFHYEIYANQAAVTTPSASVLYLFGPTGSGADKYEEYVYVNSTWTKIGDTSVDLSNLGTLAYKSTVTLNKGAGDVVLGEGTSFTNSTSAVTFTGGTTDTFVKSVSAETNKKLVTTSIPNVTSAGSASTWAFAMGTGTDAETLIISGANSTAPTLGTAITAATGAIDANGTGDAIVTGVTVGDSASAVTSIGTGTAAAQTITVGTGDKITVAKYGDLSVSVS